MGYGLSKPVVCMAEEENGTVECLKEIAVNLEDLEEDDSVYEIRKSCSSSSSSSDDESELGVAARSHRETLIIFDWDDTLLCTTAINERCWIEGQLQQLENAVQQILQLAMQLGDTIIVTNGKPTWVKESCRHFFPGLLPTLDQLAVISARARFEHMFPNDPFAWKRQTFKKILQCRHRQVPEDFGLNLVVLGDSQAEIEAARTATEYVCSCQTMVKTVKFRPSPSCTQLVGELRKVKNDFDRIVSEARSVHKVLVPRDIYQQSWRAPSEASAWKFVTSKCAGNPWSKALRAAAPAGGELPSEELPGKLQQEETGQASAIATAGQRSEVEYEVQVRREIEASEREYAAQVARNLNGLVRAPAALNL